MEDISTKDKIIRSNDLSSAIEYDFTWIFSNGSESEQNRRSFKHNLVNIISRDTTSRLVLKKNTREY